MRTRPPHTLKNHHRQAAGFIPRAKPRVFRQTRILIVGCGQVGQRLLQLYPKQHFIATYRPGANANAKRMHLQALHAQTLALDHQNKHQLQRAVAVARRIIWLAPPQAQGRNQELLQAGLYARLKHQRYGGLAPCISYVSTTGVYGNTQGATVDEQSPVQPHTARAKRRVQAEQHLKTLTQRVFAHSQARLIAQRLRAPGIYSSQRLPLERIGQKLPAICREEDSWSNHIHEVDLARLCWWAQFKTRGLTTINACDQHPSRMGDYFDLVADWAQLPRPPRLPRALVRNQVSPMMWSFMEESRCVVSKRQAQLGFVLRYPSVPHGLAANKSKQNI